MCTNTYVRNNSSLLEEKEVSILAKNVIDTQFFQIQKNHTTLWYVVSKWAAIGKYRVCALYIYKSYLFFLLLILVNGR